MVALIVFGVALSGLLPLVAILSRHLQPLQNGASSPTRDWSNPACPIVSHQPTPWYLMACNDPWLRKLGASAQVTAGTVTFSSLPPIQPSVAFLDDYETAVNNNLTYGSGTYTGGTSTGWFGGSATSALNGTQHRKVAVVAGGTSTGCAVWSLPVTAAGWYSIQATWAASSDQVTDAQFTMQKTTNGSTSAIGAATVNQQAAPAGIADSNSSGRFWVPLTSLVQLAANDIVQVQLSDVRATSTDPGTYYVAADAVRIVRNDVAINSVTRSFGCKNPDGTAQPDVKANVSVTVNIPQ